MTLAARIRRLSVAFHERTILHDITLDIPAEGITVLLGRSGSVGAAPQVAHGAAGQIQGVTLL